MVQEVAKHHFPLSGVVNHPVETEEELAARDAVLQAKKKEVAVNGEILLFSSCFLAKDIVKVIQTVVITPFQCLRVFLKFLSPVLNVWVLRYDVAKLWTHIKERRAVPNEVQSAELMTEEREALDLARRVTQETVAHDYIGTALDVAYLAMTIISFVTLAVLTTMPPALGIALSIAGFLALLASCANKISKNMMSGSLKEIEDEHIRAALIALQNAPIDNGEGVGFGIGVA